MPRTTTYKRPEQLSRALRRLPDVAARELERAGRENAGALGPALRSAGAAAGGVAPYVAAAITVEGDRIVIGSDAQLPSGRGTVADVLWGAEFGSNDSPQFRPWRGAGDGAGYWIWPTVDEASERMRDVWSDGLADALDKL